jgi:pSer/pThr/pTyr-binding forkhead associated (FHA) protein
LAKASITAGRASTADIVLRDPNASRSHTRFDCTPDGCFAIDLGSANGTRLNGSRIDRARLNPGDVIQIADCRLVFEAGGDAGDLEDTRPETAEFETSLATTRVSMHLEDTRTPRLAVHTPGHTWEAPLAKETCSIGRHPDNDIVLHSPKVSRHHAIVERRGDEFLVRDLDSDNGTFVGPHRVESRLLAEDDTITIGPARLVFKPGFAEEDLTAVDAPAQRDGSRRPVVVVPGFLGSNLWLGNQRVWPDFQALVQKPELFALREGGPIYTARGLTDELVIVPNLIRQEQYGTLIAYLEEALGYQRGNDLLEFGYDFRTDIRDAARHLAEAIENWRVRRPLTILAHSMGTLVSRYYVEHLGGHKLVDRLVLLGGPHAGAPKALSYVLLGLSWLQLGSVGERVRDALATFPSLYQLFPNYQCGADQNGRPVDWLNDSSWLQEQFRPYLRYACELRAELGVRSSVPAVCIFGYGMKTATSLRLERDADGRCLKSEAVYDSAGDGTVPESSAILEGAEIHPVRQYHGTLHVDQDVKKRLKVELTR